MSPRRTRGSLSDADRALWEHVIREIRPLRGRKPRPKKDVKSGSEPAAPGAEVELAGKPPVAKLAKAPGKTATPRPPAGPPPLAPIERRTRLRLVRGVVEIDARIDLHGLTRHEAHGRLTRFLIQAQGHGARIVLVITGKGAPAGWGPERGAAPRGAAVAGGGRVAAAGGGVRDRARSPWRRGRAVRPGAAAAGVNRMPPARPHPEEARKAVSKDEERWSMSRGEALMVRDDASGVSNHERGRASAQ